MSIGKGFQSVADTLLNAMGSTVTFTVETKDYDPALGRVTDILTDVSHTVKCTPPKTRYPRYQGEQGQGAFGDSPGDLIEQGVIEFSISAKGLKFTPNVGHTITLDDEKFRVVAVERIYAQDLVVLYKVRARK